MTSPSGRALIFSYSDCTHYLTAITQEPEGQSNAAQLIKTAEGKLAKYPSVYRAKEAFKKLGFTHGWLVMHSPYDEMIGTDPAQKTEMPLLFNGDD